MKRVLIAILLGLVCFLAGVILFFPYEKAARWGIEKAIAKAPIPIKYTTLSVSGHQTRMTGVTVQNIPVESLTCNYSPFGLIFRRVECMASSPLFQAQVRMNGRDIDLTGRADLTRVSARIPQAQAASPKGSLSVQANYSLKKKTGTAVLSSEVVEFSSAMGNIRMTNPKANAHIDNDILTLDSFTSEGQVQAKAAGTVKLNMFNLANSMLDISGEGSVMGMTSGFVVKGPAQRPAFSLNSAGSK